MSLDSHRLSAGQNRSLLTTWRKRARPAVSLLKRRLCWSRGSFCPSLRCGNSYWTSFGNSPHYEGHLSRDTTMSLLWLPLWTFYLPCCSVFLLIIKGQQHCNSSGRDGQREDHPADTVPAWGRLHQLRHGGLHTAPQSGSHECGQESQWGDEQQPGRGGEPSVNQTTPSSSGLQLFLDFHLPFSQTILLIVLVNTALQWFDWELGVVFLRNECMKLDHGNYCGKSVQCDVWMNFWNTY